MLIDYEGFLLYFSETKIVCKSGRDIELSLKHN